MKKRLIILENEKEHIKGLYGLLTELNGVDVSKNSPERAYCPRVTKNSNITGVNSIFQTFGSSDFLWGGSKATTNVGTNISETEVNNKLNLYAEEYIRKGIPNRTACQVALNKIRPMFRDKNMIIIDSLNKLIYVFDKNNNFIAKDVMISGYDKQSNDSKIIARSLLTWEEECNREGFKYIEGKGYVDTTGKNRKYDPELIYAATARDKVRFLPKGIFNTSSKLKSGAGYAGATDNIINLTDLGGKEISQAIHGYYLEQPRTAALNKAKSVLSNPNDPKVSKEFLDLVTSKSVNLSQSYGCINLSPDFLPILRKYMTNSYIFNISEDSNNYLVKNVNDYFNKVTNSSTCPSPNEFGGEQVDEWV